MARLFTLLLAIVGLTASHGPEESITVAFHMEGCRGKLNLYSFDGIAFNKLMSAENNNTGLQTFRLPKSGPRFYYLGLTDNKVSPILLGSEENLGVRGQCGNLRRMEYHNSPLNKGYISLKKQISDFNKQTRDNATRYQQALHAPAERAAIKKEMDRLDQKKLFWMDSVRSKSEFLGKIAALNVYLSYPNHGGSYANELDYFVKTYFQFVDWNDPAYNDIVYVFEAFRQFTNVLTNVGLTTEQHKAYLDSELLAIPPESKANRYALGGVLSVLQQKNHPNYLHFAKRYLQYFDDGSEGAENLKRRMNTAKTFVAGEKAPDFKMATPQGNTFSLSQLKGKVVLIDFWASWCGPCRRENPEVVRLYERFKDRGFDILGVSLDQRKERWTQAIELDGLNWHHVSDLQGWKNKVARLYGVNSIPHTVLVDRDGRILARGLRGPALERKVEEVLRDL